MKKFIILILLLFSIFTVLSLQAKTIQSTIKKFHDAQDLIQYENSPQSQQTKKNVFNLFKWMKLVGTRKKLLTTADMKKYIDTNICFIVNGEIMANNRDELTNHWRHVLSVLKSLTIFRPFEKFIVSGNHAAAVYRLKTVANDGTHHLDKVNVLLSFKNNKLNYWREVSAHIKYPKYQF